MSTVRVYTKHYHSPQKEAIHIASYIALIAGCLLLFWSFYPIISFELYSRLFIQQDVISPVPMDQAFSTAEGASVLGTSQVLSSNIRDFVKASLWFPSRPQPVEAASRIEDVHEYTLSIPKINISNAKVTVGGEDLAHSLVHYLPSSLPGEYGNVAIFGHSTLPQLYNPKDYKTVFTYLPSLEKGDKIYVTVKGVQYEYEVYDMFVVKPDQVSILEPKMDASYLTLVTCVPPGTFWNRLVVRAKLTQLPLEMH